MKNLLGGFTLLVAGLLLVLAARSLPARLLALPGDDLRDAVLGGDPFDDADFTAFVASRENSVKWQGRSDYFDELAAAYAARAVRDGTSAADSDGFFRKSAAAQIAALRLEPADSYGWSQMAFLDMQLGDNVEKPADDLRLSMETAPYEPGLMASRLDMMTGLRDQLTPDERKQIPFVARQAWDADPRAVADQAQNHHYISVVEDALSDDKNALDRFHEMLPPPASQP